MGLFGDDSISQPVRADTATAKQAPARLGALPTPRQRRRARRLSSQLLSGSSVPGLCGDMSPPRTRDLPGHPDDTTQHAPNSHGYLPTASQGLGCVELTAETSCWGGRPDPGQGHRAAAPVQGRVSRAPLGQVPRTPHDPARHAHRVPGLGPAAPAAGASPRPASHLKPEGGDTYLPGRHEKAKK